MPLIDGGSTGIRPIERQRPTEGSDRVRRRDDGGGGFRPQTNVNLKTAIQDIAATLGKISTEEKTGLQKLPKEIGDVVQNILRQSLSVNSTLGKGIGSTVESQRFSMDQLMLFSRMLLQIGTLAEKGYSMKLSEETQVLLSNFKDAIIAEEGGDAFEPILMTKSAFELVDAKTAEQLPQALYEMLSQLANAPVANQQQQPPSESMQFLKQLVRYFMPRPEVDNFQQEQMPQQPQPQPQQGQQPQGATQKFLESMFRSFGGKFNQPNNQGQPTQFNQPNNQGQPTQFNQPNSQEQPAQFNQPNSQGQPAQFNQPNSQGQPTQFNQPNNQGQPTQFNQPNNQGQPTQFNQPNTQGQPAQFNQPNSQGQPTQFNQPNSQGQPTQFNQPNSQGQPTQFNQPNSQGQPTQFNQPNSQGQPTPFNQPNSQGQPTPFNQPNSQGQPTPFNQPNAQGQPTQFNQPNAQGQPTQFNQPNSQGQPTQFNQPNTQGQPTQFNQPNSQGQPTQFNEPNAQGQPTQFNQSNAQGQPTQFNQPNAQGQPTQFNQPNAQEQPAQFNQPNSQGQPAQFNQPNAQGQPTQFNQSNAQGQATQFNQPNAQGQPTQFNQSNAQGQATQFNQPNAQGQPTQFNQPNAQGQPAQFNQPNSQGQPTQFNQPNSQGQPTQFNQLNVQSQATHSEPIITRRRSRLKPKNVSTDFIDKQYEMRAQMDAAKNAMIKQNLQNTPQTNDAMKNLAQFLMRNPSTSQRDAALLQNFVNNSQQMMPETEARHLQNLLRLCQNNIPLTVQQAAVQQKLPDLPRLWAFMQMCDMANVTSKMNARAFKRAGRDVADFTNSMRHAMSAENSVIQNQRSFQMMLPLYMGDNEKSYPTYLNVYDENTKDEETGEIKKETWFRVCVLTDYIGAAELVFRVYDETHLDMRFYFSRIDIAEEFRSTYLDALRNSLKTTELNVGEVRVGGVGERMFSF